MPDIQIRRLEGDPMLDILYTLNSYAFFASPPVLDKDDFLKYTRLRTDTLYCGLFEDGLPAAGAASTAMLENVRGCLYPAGGVWGVATAPSARRKGYGKKNLIALLKLAYESGAVFSTLYPFRESFYERLGYVTFPLPLKTKFNTLALTPLLKQDFGGQVEVELMVDAYDTFRQFLLAIQPAIHGMGVFSQPWPYFYHRHPAWAAIARVEGRVEGFMVYQVEGQEVAHFRFIAWRFYYLTSRGRYLLLDWIARHIDQALEAEIFLLPYEHPETWLSDLKVTNQTAGQAPMGRVLDVARCGGMQTGPGNFTAQIIDPLCPWNEGAWRFETQDGKLTVCPGISPECSLTIQGLSALFYGSHSPQDIPLRGWGDPSTELQARLGQMFPPQTPFLHENF